MNHIASSLLSSEHADISLVDNDWNTIVQVQYFKYYFKSITPHPILHILSHFDHSAMSEKNACPKFG